MASLRVFDFNVAGFRRSKSATKQFIMDL